MIRDKMRTWWERKVAECKPNVKAVVTKRHHYYVAAAMSMVMLGLGWMEFHFHLPHWLYALNETLFSGHRE